MFKRAIAKLQERIEEVIWSRDSSSSFFSLENGLYLASRIYGPLAAADRALFSSGIRKVHKLPCPVVSIGNLAVGGTGKTPFVRYLACRLKKLGFKVAIISRGYKGALEGRGGIVSDGDKVWLDARRAGDEPWLLASTLPQVSVGVGKDRLAVGKFLMQKAKPQVIILDDGFQHHRLARDLDIVLLDGHDPVGNGCLLPRGPLREPLEALDRAGAMVLTFKTGQARTAPRLGCKGPVFQALYRPVVILRLPPGKHCQVCWPDLCLPAEPEKTLHGKPALVFSAVARNLDFRRSVETMGAMVAGWLDFADHHWFSAADVEMIKAKAFDSGAEILVTTAKDFVRLAGYQWPLELVVCDLEVDLGKQDERFLALVLKELKLYT